MLSIILISGTLITAILAIVLTKKKFRLDSPSFLSWLLFSLSFIGGLIFIIWQQGLISREFERHSWPTVQASVIATTITGERAYNPALTCRYRVNGTDYILTTDLDTPPFGRKRTRRQTAEIIIAEHPIGSEIKVHYNPDKPEQALVRTGPFWNNYMILITGVMLFGTGSFGLMKKFTPFKHRQVSGREHAGRNRP